MSIVDAFRSQESNPKTIQLLLWIYTTQMNKSPSSKLTKSIYEDETLIKGVLGLLEVNSPVVRGRVYIFIHFFLQYSIKKCIYLTDSKLFHIIDKQNKDGSKYEVQCLQYTLVIISENYSSLIKLCQEDIKKSMKGAAIQLENYRKNPSFISIIYHLATCPVF